MWTRYISPDELSAQQAAQVLAFLNEAQTAQQIAERVELADELDVGLRVAQRLLDRRAALGGAFANVTQVAAVPYVGPERFTEIVATITGFSPPRVTLQSLLLEIAALRAELQQRTASAAQDGRALSVDLRALLPRGYVGQRVSLQVHVSYGVSGPPAIDVPVTLVTTWGELHAADGFSDQRGQSITLCSNIEGCCRASLVPAALEVLRADQQAALDALLEPLSLQAATPREVSVALSGFVAAYRKPGAAALRRAIDVYFESFAARYLEDAPVPDFELPFPLENATVIAYAQLGTRLVPSATVGGSAVLTQRFRNWLPAFLATHRAAARTEKDLHADISELLRKPSSAEALLPAAYARIERFVELQEGKLGRFVAEDVAKQTLRDVLDTDIAALPLDTRIALRAGLSATARTLVGRDGFERLATISANQAAQRSVELTSNAAVETRLHTELESVRGQIAELATSLDLKIDGKLDANTFEGFRSKLETDVGKLEVDVGMLRIGRPG